MSDFGKMTEIGPKKKREWTKAKPTEYWAKTRGDFDDSETSSSPSGQYNKATHLNHHIPTL